MHWKSKVGACFAIFHIHCYPYSYRAVTLCYFFTCCDQMENKNNEIISSFRCRSERLVLLCKCVERLGTPPRWQHVWTLCVTMCESTTLSLCWSVIKACLYLSDDQQQHAHESAEQGQQVALWNLLVSRLSSVLNFQECFCSGEYLFCRDAWRPSGVTVISQNRGTFRRRCWFYCALTSLSVCHRPEAKSMHFLTQWCGKLSPEGQWKISVHILFAWTCGLGRLAEGLFPTVWQCLS